MKVKWLNDSSCVLHFPNKEQCAEALYGFSVKDQEMREANDQTNQETLDERNFDAAQGWRQALGYEHDKRGWQCLWLRYATDQDVKPEEQSGKDSRFYR
jgi:hypothetical protein